MGNHEVTSWSNNMFTRQPFSFPIESLPAFLAIHNIKKYRGKGRFVRAGGGGGGGGALRGNSGDKAGLKCHDLTADDSR